jgi:aspartate dehydrogenase
MIVALIGCGFIGQTLAKHIAEEMIGRVELKAVYDEKIEKATQLAQILDTRTNVAENFDAILSDDTIELVIEAASQFAAKSYVSRTLTAGKNVMVLSVGALADKQFYDRIVSIAREKRLRVYVPSGAIGGLDWIKAASRTGLQRVILTTRKPPKAFEGSPYVVRNNIDLSTIRYPLQLYEGPASDAASSFPANVNVAVLLSLASIGVQKTLVRVVADPTVKQNIHEITAEGAAGNITVRVENEPSPMNPKTSWIAAQSAIQKLEEIVSPLSLGT